MQDAPVLLMYHENGGHCGFVTTIEDIKDEERWLPQELARFLKHAESTIAQSAGEL